MYSFYIDIFFFSSIITKGEVKVNIGRAAKSAPSDDGYGRIFRTRGGFSKGCFVVYFGIKFAFEVEVLGFITIRGGNSCRGSCSCRVLFVST